MNQQTLLKEAEQQKEKLVEMRRFLHQHPGTGFEISETLDYVEAQLREMGLEPQRCGRAGIVATIQGKEDGPVFLLRADMDALPVQEETDCDFASQNGSMHACGHDMHTAMLLGAAKLLKQHEQEIVGTVKCMFQPAEEIFEGSQDMIQDGLLENPKVEAGMMIHVMSNMPIPAGTVIVSAPGVSAPAADYFSIVVQGKGCHGSMPHTGIDPVTVAAHIIIGLQEISAREVAIQDQMVLTIGCIQGGETANVIPDRVELKGSLRTFDEEVREMVKKRMEEITSSIAEAYRASAEIVWGSGCPTLINDESLSQQVGAAMKELLGEERVLLASEMSQSGAKSSGSEDFAYVSHEIPTIMLALAAGEPDKGYAYPQHHPKVQFDESVLPVGSAVYSYAALQYLKHSVKE
ncbi:MAG: M20 family metallopeptidase [Agathobacter sp.]